MRWNRTQVAIAFGATLAAACGNEYPIEPTVCDDWCLATTQADCSYDPSPHECVAECEGVWRIPGCDESFARFVECLLDQPSTSFSCLGGMTTGYMDVCRLEQVTYYACSAPEYSACSSICSALRSYAGQAGGCSQEAPFTSCDFFCTLANGPEERRDVEALSCAVDAMGDCMASQDFADARLAWESCLAEEG